MLTFPFMVFLFSCSKRCLNDLALHFDYERTWWMLFLKRASMSTKNRYLPIYSFIFTKNNTACNNDVWRWIVLRYTFLSRVNVYIKVKYIGMVPISFIFISVKYSEFNNLYNYVFIIHQPCNKYNVDKSEYKLKLCSAHCDNPHDFTFGYESDWVIA